MSVDPSIAEQRADLAATIDALSAKAHVTSRMKEAAAERRQVLIGSAAAAGAVLAVVIVYRRRAGRR